MFCRLFRQIFPFLFLIIHISIIFITVYLIILIKLHQNLCIIVCIKALPWKIHEATDASISKRSIASLKLYIIGGLRQSYNGIFCFCKAFQIIFIVRIRKHQRLPDIFLSKTRRIHKTLSGILRHTAFHKFNSIYIFREIIGL